MAGQPLEVAPPVVSQQTIAQATVVPVSPTPQVVSTPPAQAIVPTIEIQEVPTAPIPDSPQPITEVADQGKRISALSLNSIRAKRNLESSLEKVTVNPNDLPREPFSFEQLMIEWEWYADKMGRNGFMLMYSLMGMTKPSLKGVHVHLELPNEGSRLSFSEQQMDLANHLRRKLNNYDLEIRINVNEEIQLVKKVFDTKDKYEHFVALNPNMELLKQVFDLEFK